VAPAARRRNAKLSFAFVFPDKNGRFKVQEVNLLSYVAPACHSSYCHDFICVHI